MRASISFRLAAVSASTCSNSRAASIVASPSPGVCAPASPLAASTSTATASAGRAGSTFADSSSADAAAAATTLSGASSAAAASARTSPLASSTISGAASFASGSSETVSDSSETPASFAPSTAAVSSASAGNSSSAADAAASAGTSSAAATASASASPAAAAPAAAAISASWNCALQNLRCAPASGSFQPQKYDSTLPWSNAYCCASRSASRTRTSWHPAAESWFVASDHSETAVCAMPFLAAASFISFTFACTKRAMPFLVSSGSVSHDHVSGAECSHARYMCVSRTAHDCNSSAANVRAIHSAMLYTFKPHVSMRLTKRRGGRVPTRWAGSTTSARKSAAAPASQSSITSRLSGSKCAGSLSSVKPPTAARDVSGSARYHRSISRTTPLPMVISVGSSQNAGGEGNTPLYEPMLEPPGMVCMSISTFSPASASVATYRSSAARDTVTCFLSGCAGSVTSFSGSSASDANAAQVRGRRT